MLDKFLESLSSSSIDLINNGYKIFEVEDHSLLNEITNQFKDFIKKEQSIELDDFSSLHKHLNIKDLNSLRYSFFQQLNCDNTFSKKYLNLGYDIVNDVVGSELAANKSVNFSIQMPNDSTSKLSIHSDTFSGESEFQINLWVPLTNTRSTNSMFIFNPDFSRKVIENIGKYEKKGIEHLLETNKDEYKFLELKYGEALIFTPTCLHGNVVNTTNETRISFNCRYKNLYSPYCENEENEKKLGAFYIPITPKAATIIGLKNKIKY